MAKDISKQLQEILKRRITKPAKDSLSASFLTKLANETAEQVRRRTRIGKGVKASGAQESLAPLKPSTKAIRKRYRQNLSTQTRPNKSNLTATGNLLDSIQGKKTTKGLVIFIKDRARKSLSGGISRIKNTKLAEILQRKGPNRAARPFFSLTKAEENEIRRKIRDKIRKAI